MVVWVLNWEEYRYECGDMQSIYEKKIFISFLKLRRSGLAGLRLPSDRKDRGGAGGMPDKTDILGRPVLYGGVF